MRVTGIIAEYNPFHSGHEYHIREAKAKTGADWCIVVMSGDFVQRGEPAIFSKYLRTRMALACGAALVLEMPSAFAISSAEDFAACGVALLSSLGVVNTLCFGSEDGELAGIQEVAAVLATELPLFSTYMKQGLGEGLSWPQARNRALLLMAREKPDFPVNAEKLNLLLGSPNNLLGIEYCKAILRQSSPIVPVTVKRTGQGYHDTELDSGQASASALRRILLSGNTDLWRSGRHGQALHSQLLSHIPQALAPLYVEEGTISAGDMSTLLNYELLSAKRQGRPLTAYAGLSEDMARRLDKRLLMYENWEGRIGQLKTRQYTYTRVSRALLHLVLGITEEQIQAYKGVGQAPYARVLGFRSEAAQLLSAIKKQSSIPLITKTADASRILNGIALDMLEQDLHASHIRQTIYAQKYAVKVTNEYNQPLCIV